MGREKGFYEEISRLPNVRLIDQSLNSFELIDNARAVVTLTGTIGLEALMRNIPVMVFGLAWYRNSPSVYNITTRKECKDALLDIYNNEKISSKLAQSYILGLSKNFSKGYLNPSNKSSIDISFEEHVINLYNVILAAYHN